MKRVPCRSASRSVSDSSPRWNDVGDLGAGAVVALASPLPYSEKATK